jgi:hypothetical protein
LDALAKPLRPAVMAHRQSDESAGFARRTDKSPVLVKIMGILFFAAWVRERGWK